ncbi:MAG: peptidase MA family metallohydrolase [Ignavibacteriaceae bacterium]|nr:peptidase MA family metallohydrolase [Ignavibacteriaceae bacterium]MCW8813989.1 peptidase MA family metallohydrolase [Chlorobium sp.]MCW9098389.1 peptidase MA family metallohydrolase [Ignavibacteriaceae bacterium]
MKIILRIFALIFLTQVCLFAQFGKNKVQYKYFDWYYVQTKHFDIYFANGGETLAEFTTHIAEDALSKIQESFKYSINNRVTVIVYNSQNDFQETNVTDTYLSEGIEGFTELFKNRVVVQFHGSYKQFRHLIHHELVHAVMNDMFYGGSLQNIIANNITVQIPSWFSEGMAEYQALGWDEDTDMFIRDAAINEYLPDVQNLSGYFAYRGGQAVFYYIAKKYGKEKIGELVNALRSLGNVDAALKQTIGLNLKEFNERWKKDIKRVFWPDIEITQDPDEFAKRLTDPEGDEGFYNVGPAISPQGDKIAFITNRDFFFSLYVMDANTGKIITKLAEGNTSANFEELNILTPGLTWSPDGSQIAVAALHHGYDIIYIFNVEEDDYYTLPLKMDGIQSVNWSPDGKQLAFIGQTPKQTDIYTYTFETKEVKNLTDDIFTDKDPCWSHDGKLIFFASDRNSYKTIQDATKGFKIYNHDYSQTEIYSLEVETGQVNRITDMPNSNETSPIVSPDDSQILFISDLNGINNIYKKNVVFSSGDNFISDIKDIKPVPVTNSQSGLYQLSVSRDGKKLAFSSLYKSSFNIFLLNNPFETDLGLPELPLTKYRQGKLNLDVRPNEVVKEQKGIKENEKALEDSSDFNSSMFYSGNFVDSTKKYGDSVTVDFGNYVFGGDNKIAAKEDNEKDLFNPIDNLDERGNFKINKYKISFAPDLIYANAGYSTLYGLIGTTIISFSDVLGNHRLIGVTGLQIDLKNSDYGLAYYYLAKRINWGIEGFHTARFVRLLRIDPRGFAVSNLFRYRNFGLSGSASFPLDRYYRFDFGVSILNVIGENLDNIAEPQESVTFTVPQISFVHDNVLWGYTAPIEGTRYRFDVFGNLGITDPNKSFYSIIGDIRTYLRFFYDHSLALRISGGYSGGENPQRFFIGGTENWINRTFATTEIPIESASDFAFLTAVLPLRGYNYSERIGTRYLLANMELRFPLIRYLLTGGLPLLFSNIIGVAFIDAGSTWYDNSKIKLFSRDSAGNIITDDLLIGTGVGARVYFLYFLLRFDVAWAYNVKGFSSPKFYFSLGADF